MIVPTGWAYDEPLHRQFKLSTEEVLEHLLSNQEAMPEFLEPLLDHLERKNERNDMPTATHRHRKYPRDGNI